MNQAFYITQEVLSAMTNAEVRATCEGLREMGLYHLPFPTVDIITEFDAVVCKPDRSKYDEKLGPDTLVRVTVDMECTETFVCVELLDRNRTYGLGTEAFNSFARESDSWKNLVQPAAPWRDLLIAVLASRGIVKEVVGGKPSKLAKMGIGKAKPPKPIVTYIRLAPSLPADEDGKPSGTTRRPHLRRGHIRNQRDRFGHHKVWIAPIFVNADKDFVDSRQAYVFTK